jgi:hypothetical protein
MSEVMAGASPPISAGGAHEYRTRFAWTALIYTSVVALLLVGVVGRGWGGLPYWAVGLYLVVASVIGALAAPQALAKLSLSENGLAYWLKWGRGTSWVFRWKDIEGWSIATESDLAIALGRQKVRSESRDRRRARRRADREFFEAQADPRRRYLLFKVQGADRIHRLDPAIVTKAQFEEIAGWFRRCVGEPRQGNERLHLRIAKRAPETHQYTLRARVIRVVDPEAGTPADLSQRVRIEGDEPHLRQRH